MPSAGGARVDCLVAWTSFAAGANGTRNLSGTCRFYARIPAIAGSPQGATEMHGLIYLIGLIVVIMAILSFFGLR